MMQADWTPLTEEQKQRAGANIRLAWFAVKRHLQNANRLVLGAEKDALDAEALLALCRASRGFKAERNVRFSTYAMKYIYWWLHRYERNNRLKKRAHHLAFDLAFELVGKDDPPDCESREEIDKILKLLPSPRDRDVLRLRFVEGRTLGEIAKKHAVSDTMVGHLIQRSTKELRKRLTTLNPERN